MGSMVLHEVVVFNCLLPLHFEHLPQLDPVGSNGVSDQSVLSLEEWKDGREGVKVKRKNIGRKDRSLSSSDVKMKLQRRSSRLANRYWKSLKGVSSEAKPIISSSESSEDEKEKKAERDSEKKKEGGNGSKEAGNHYESKDKRMLASGSGMQRGSQMKQQLTEEAISEGLWTDQ